ncbi:MAG: hypothetical protein J6F30_12055 [Cellulosilyticum sp.]|nr:hypothetical protein [Cellulosilyticum sp.]
MKYLKVQVRLKESSRSVFEKFCKDNEIKIIGEYKNATGKRGRPAGESASYLIDNYFKYINEDITPKEYKELTGYGESSFYHKIQELQLLTLKEYHKQCKSRGKDIVLNELREKVKDIKSKYKVNEKGNKENVCDSYQEERKICVVGDTDEDYNEQIGQEEDLPLEFEEDNCDVLGSVEEVKGDTSKDLEGYESGNFGSFDDFDKYM